MGNRMKEWAFTYLSKGLHPIPTENKIPPKNYEGWQDRPVSKEEIVQWPDLHQLGIKTGPVSKLFVLDWDIYKEGAKELLTGKMLPITPTARTQNGGLQYYFRWDPRLDILPATTLRAIFGKDGVDTRGKGGYVVAPPSPKYSWLPGRDLSTPLAFAPDWLVQVLANRSSGPKYVGPRHPEFIRIACRYFNEGKTEAEVEELMAEWNAEVNSQPFDEKRFKKEFEDICKPWRDGRYVSNKTKEVLRTMDSVPIVPETEVEGEDFDSFIVSGPSETTWLVDKMIPETSITIIAGLGETKKTWLLMDLAVEVARGGGKWVGLHPTNGGKVMYIDQERGHIETRRRLKKLAAAKNITSLKGKLIVYTGTTYRVDVDKSFQALRKQIEKHQPKVVLVDSFVTFHTKDDKDRAAAQVVFERLKALRNEFGCAFILLDHETKAILAIENKDRKPNMNDTHGSAGKVNAAEVVFNVRAIDDFYVKVYPTKGTCVEEKVPPFTVSVENIREGQSEVKGMW